jgi:DNA-binding transcriptional ArsR family regulator
MLRIHLTPADLGRVQLSGPDLMAELVSSAQLLVAGRSGRRFPGLARDVPPAARPLLQLVERPDGCPDFLIPGGGLDYGPALTTVLSTPTARLRDDLRDYREHCWTADPERVRGDLAIAIDAYYRQAFRSRWHHAAALASRDQAMRAQVLLRGGLDELLPSIWATLRWQPPMLVFDCDLGGRWDVHLAGRGLRFVPVVALDLPSVLDRPGQPLEIMYPAQPPESVADGPNALGALLGRTRARVLGSVGVGATTSQLAARAGISAPSASEHATVLRNAGLIASAREGGTVVHRLTPLGRALLRPSR